MATAIYPCDARHISLGSSGLIKQMDSGKRQLFTEDPYYFFATPQKCSRSLQSPLHGIETPNQLCHVFIKKS